MAKLPSITRVRREDIPDAPDWIEKLLTPLNQFMESVYGALNKNLALEANVTAQIKELTFSTDTSGAIQGDLSFQRTLKTKAKGLLVLQLLEDADNHTPHEGAVHVDWLDISGVIEIYAISELSPSTDYRIRVLLL